MDNREQKNFGVPEVDNTPMGQIGMMGRFYRGMGERQIKSPIVRIVGTLFALLFLVIPEILWLFMFFTVEGSTVHESLAAMVGYVLLGGVLLAVGIKIIYNLNFRRKK